MDSVAPLNEGYERTRGALVTGGASGIGRATVERLLADGWEVLLADLNTERGTQAAAEMGVPFLRTDVAAEVDVAAAVEATVAAFGRIDCVVNNAGVGGAFGPITEIEVEDWDYTFAVLVRSVFLGIKHGARGDAGGGPRRVDCQHGLDRGVLRWGRAAGVRGGEGGGAQPRARGGGGAGTGSDPGQHGARA